MKSGTTGSLKKKLDKMLSSDVDEKTKQMEASAKEQPMSMSAQEPVSMSSKMKEPTSKSEVVELRSF